MNKQTPEKAETRHNDDMLSVHSIFRTIQGEGPFCGTPAVFIRLAGCNLQCPKCDTDYTTGRQLLSSWHILTEVRDLQKGGLVVVTGGEPFRQDLTELLVHLVDFGFYVQIETNGSLPATPVQYCTSPDARSGVYIICSPKAGKVHKLIEKNACAYKYVLSDGDVNLSDGLPCHPLEHPSKPFVARPPEGWSRPIYLQPEDAQDKDLNNRNLDATVKSCMEHGYILQLQVHKIIGME